MILLAARFLFDVPIAGDLVLLALVLILFIAANLAVGFTFSTAAQNQLQAMQMTFFFFLPSILLSRLHVPVPRHAAVGAVARRGPAADPLPAHRARHPAQGQRRAPRSCPSSGRCSPSSSPPARSRCCATARRSTDQRPGAAHGLKLRPKVRPKRPSSPEVQRISRTPTVEVSRLMQLRTSAVARSTSQSALAGDDLPALPGRALRRGAAAGSAGAPRRMVGAGAASRLAEGQDLRRRPPALRPRRTGAGQPDSETGRDGHPTLHDCSPLRGCLVVPELRSLLTL